MTKSVVCSYRSLILATLPAMFAVVLEPMAEMIDTAILGHESALWVAGLATTNACLGAFTWIFNFLSYGVTAQVAQSFGAKKKGEVGAHIRAALLLALLIGCTVGTVLLLLDDWLLVTVMGTEGELYHTAKAYYSIRVWGYPFTILSISLIGILRGVQQIAYSGVVVLLMTLTNGVGTYLSVFYLGLGVEGAAIATVASFLLGNVLAIAGLYAHRHAIGLANRWRVAWEDLTELGRDGFNLAGRTGCLLLAYFLCTACATRLGVVTVAAHQVALQAWFLASFLIDGLGITATAIGGQLIGEKDYTLHKLMVRRLMVIGFGLGILFFGSYLLAESSLIGLYTDQPDIIATVGSVWLVIAVAQPINAFTYVFDGVLFGNRAFGFLRRRMVEGFLICFLPLLLWGFFLDESLLGLWLALASLNVYRAITGWKGVKRGEGLERQQTIG